MKNFFLSTLTWVLILLSVTATAQINRANNKKSVPYRANYQRMATGPTSYSTFEIRGGTLWAWGDNSGGQLGDGTTIDKTSPVQIGTDTKWVSVSAGVDHTVAIKSDGTLWAWGDNSFGQLGDGTTSGKSSPVQVGTDTKWVSIFAGYFHTIGIKSDGTLWAWGDNSFGQLGDGTTSGKSSPVQVGTDTKWVSVSAGEYHTMGIKSDGTLWAWGDNSFGQLGDGTTTGKSSPVQVGTDTKWVSVAAGFYHTVGTKSDGTLWAWGRNDYHELGDGTTTQRNSPVQIGTDDKWVSISAGGDHTMGIKSDGTLWAWGFNGFGWLGDGTTTDITSPVQIGTDKKWVSIIAGAGHTVGIKSDGTLLAWGYNGFGQLGDGTTTDKTSPVQVSATDNVWLKIAAGAYHTIGIKSDGRLWAWGLNIFGELGDGTTVNQSSPVQIGTDTKWVSVSAHDNQTMGIKSDGTLWAWGYNGNGQLGDGTTVNQSSPVQIGTDNKWVSVSAGEYHTMGIKSDGTLWAWGFNTYGQLGDGTTVNQTSPVQIGTDNQWVSIAAGYLHTMGIKSDGTLWAWGENSSGTLGNGTTVNQTSPVQIGTDNKWISVSAAATHTVAIKSDGTLWAWGYNLYGQLGDGTTSNKISPVQIGTDNKWVSVSAGEYHTMGIKSDGTLWAWGWNPYGQLGDGTNSDKTSPVQIGTDTKWVSVSTRANHTVGIKSERAQFCATGFNLYGQLGDGTTTNKNSFACNTNSTCTPPSAPISSNVSICSGNSIILTATGTGTFGWYSAATGGTYLGAGTNYTTPVLTANATYYIQDSTCAASATRTAVLVTVTAASTGDTTAIVCDSSFTWYGNTYTSSSNSHTHVFTSAGGCDSIVTLHLILSSVGNIIGSGTACGIAGTPALATYSIDNIPGATYVWTKSSTLIQFSGAQNTNSVNVTFGSAYLTGTITVTVTTACGITTKTILVTKKIPLTPGVIRGAINPCEYVGTGAGTQTTYFISSVQGTTSYIWTLPAGVTRIGGNAADAFITVTYPAVFTSGIFTVKAVNACGVGPIRSLTVTVALPAIPGVITASKSVCAAMFTGTTVTYSIPPVALANAYIWTLPAGMNLSTGQGTTNLTVSFNPGFVSGVLKVRSVRKCGSSHDRQLSLTKTPPATPGSITMAGTICNKENVTDSSTVVFSIASTANTSSYVWNIPSGSRIVTGQGTTSITVKFKGTFTHGTVSVKSSSICGLSVARLLDVSSIICPMRGQAAITKGELNEAATNFTLYPNPTNGNFTIKMNSVNKKDAVRVQIIDILGAVVRSYTMPNNNGIALLEVKDNQLNNGLYIIKCTVGKEVKTLKCNIQK